MAEVSKDKSELFIKNESNEIDMQKVITDLYKAKWLLLVIVLVVSFLSFGYALLLPDKYKSDVLLAPVNSDASGLSGLSSKFGGLASLAGVSLPSGSTDKTVIGLEVLQSRKFIGAFITKHGVLIDLIAAKTWDSETKTLEIDPAIYNQNSFNWVREPEGKRQTVPTSQEAYEEFTKRLKITKDGDSGFVTISFTHLSPIFAKKILEKLVLDLNSTTKDSDVLQAQKSILYLKQQLELNELSELNSILYELIQSQTETIMLANANPEYLFQTIDPPVVPEEAIGPKRLLFGLLGGVLSFLIGVVFISVIALREEK
jgi:uncharacterized protein involved in exopolysaccharide biosynthesis